MKIYNFNYAHKKACKKYRKNNPDKVKDVSLRYEFDISLKEYEKIFEEQKGLCAICGNPEKEKRASRLIRLAIDHNHQTGKIRELLCKRCNVVLGFVEEDIDLLLNFINYLRKHQ